MQTDYRQYFFPDYRSCRQAFRDTLASADHNLPTDMIITPGQLSVDTDRDLTIDTALLTGREPSPNLMLISSGLHGAEGFAGSALQLCFIREVLPAIFRNQHSLHCDILLLHGLNPYGFMHMRRVDAFNVDLNRNFLMKAEQFQDRNDGYAAIQELLNPARPVQAHDLDPAGLADHLEELGRRFQQRELTEAIVRGQYAFPEGIYFGGQQFAAQRSLLEPFLTDIFGRYERILAIDIHTGYGRRDHLHFFPDVESADVRELIRRLFAGHHIDWADDEGFYRVTGEFVNYMHALCAPEQIYIPMIFEFGTLDSHLPAGGLASVHNMILENQGHHYGYATDDVRRETLRRFREMFYPSDPGWKKAVIEQGRTVLAQLPERLAAL